jgi:hypothetical protein
MPDTTDPSVVPEAVARLLVDAVNAAHTRGLEVVASGDHGVTCVSMHAAERWVPTPRARGVSPIGAAILYRQPGVPEVDVAGCLALGVSAAYMIGFVAGVAGEPPHATWQTHVARLLIGEGYFLGREIRTFIATAVCEIHEKRYPRTGVCPVCADDVPTPIHQFPARERR